MPERYERLIAKLTLQARADLCAMQQAVLFLALGVATLGTLGKIIDGPLYEGILNGKAMLIGAVETLYGVGYLLVIRWRLERERTLFAFAAVLIWCGFAGFYLRSDLHKVGAVTCLVLAASQIYGERCRWRMQKIKQTAEELASWHALEERIAQLEQGIEDLQSERRFWAGSLEYWRRRFAR